MTIPSSADDAKERDAMRVAGGAAEDWESDVSGAEQSSVCDSSDKTPPPPPPAAPSARRSRSAVGLGQETIAATTTPPGERGTRRLPRIPGYEIMGVLGDGGMGVVYKARQIKPERIVALKMIRAGELANSAIVQRFEVEINAVAKLHHTHIVQLYEIGESGGLPYFTMEYLEGGSLIEQMRERARTPREAAELIELLARAVHYAHERGIVHRDLKPGNVLLTPAGEPKISDFGLAKILSGSSDAPMTQTGAPLGTPEYMSPEQAKGAKHIGPATDVYSLGVILYELLTGKRPFRGDNVLHKVLTEEPPSPAWAAAVPRDLETICLKCLRKEPEQRYASADEFADDLRRFLDGKPIKGQRPSLWRRARAQARQHPRRALAALVALAVLVGALGAWTYIDSTRRDGQPAAGNVADEAEFVEHFAAATKRDGIFVGLHPLSAADVARRATSYRFVRRGPKGPLLRLEIINGRGNLTGNSDLELWIPGARSNLKRATRECQVVLEYNAEGRLASETGIDPAGRKVWVAQYSYAERPNADGTYNVVLRAIDPQDGSSVTDSAGVGTVRLVRSAEGLDVSARFHDVNGSRPMRSAETSSAVGLQGIYGADLEYRGDRISRARFVDAQGQPMANRFGVFEIGFQYNAAGDRTEEAYFDQHGAKIVNQEGVHRIVAEYDETGVPLWISQFDTQGELVGDGKGDPPSYAFVEFVRNASGQPLLHKQYNARGTLLATLEQHLDEHGNVARLTQSSFDRDGEVTTLIRTFDALGNVVREESPDGADSQTTENAFDLESNFQIGALTRDARGNQLGRLAWEYQGGRMHRSLTYDADDKLRSAIATEYDDLGRETRMKEFGPDETTLVRTTTFEYDGSSRLVTKQADEYAEDGSITVTRRTYNDRGLVSAEWYEDGEGQPMAVGESEQPAGILGSRGFQRLERTYDASGRLVQETRSGFDAATAGFSRYVEHYTAGGFLVAHQAYFDDEDRPARVGLGYSSIDHELDEFGDMVKSVYRGFDGSLGFTAQVGEYGRNASVFTYLDDQGNAVRYNGTYKKYTASWDLGLGRITQKRFDDFPPEVGYFTIVEAIDEQGRVASERYFDEDGCPVADVRGVARLDYSYAPGRRTDLMYDAAGNPAYLLGWGHSRVDYEYDESNQLVTETWSGYAPGATWEKRVRRHDPIGRVLEIAYRDAKGKLVLGDRGYARFTATYPDGQPPQAAHFDADDMPLKGEVRVEAMFVMPRSTAAKAGIQRGDILVAYNGQPIASWVQLPYFTSRTAGSTDRVNLEIERDGRRIVLKDLAPGQLGVYPDDLVAPPM